MVKTAKRKCKDQGQNRTEWEMSLFSSVTLLLSHHKLCCKHTHVRA